MVALRSVRLRSVRLFGLFGKTLNGLRSVRLRSVRLRSVRLFGLFGLFGNLAPILPYRERIRDKGQIPLRSVRLFGELFPAA